MTRVRKYLLPVLLLFVQYCGTGCDDNNITLTYIANCGFLIELNGSRIIVDGLFRYGHNLYPTPDTAVIRLMTGNLEPFNGIDLILVTHTHVDHFDRHLVTACMLNNPAAKLICPGQAIDSLRLDTLSFGRIEGRILQCSPELNTSQCLIQGEIEIHACRFPHVGGARFASTEHVAFLISGKGGSVFHSGDIDPFLTEGYEGIKINEQDVDVGLLNEDYSKPANAVLAAQFVNARNNVAMHLPEPQSVEWMDTIKTNHRLFRNPYIFTRSLERRSF